MMETALIRYMRQMEMGLRQYVYSVDGVRLAMKSQGQTLYCHYNSSGDVVEMTDQNREVVAMYEYDSWGNVLKSDTKGIVADNPFGYAGFAAYDGYNAYKKNGWKVAIAVGVGLVGGAAFKGGIYTKNGKVVTYWNNW